MLLQGSLAQIGETYVSRGDNQVKCNIDATHTQTLRLAMFRDAWPTSWEEFTEQPVRSLLKAVPTLCLCKTPGCGISCGKYHADIDELLDNLLRDLRSRLWHGADSKFTKPEAFSWSALVRVLASAQRTPEDVWTMWAICRPTPTMARRQTLPMV